jgi:hypothetical protein
MIEERMARPVANLRNFIKYNLPPISVPLICVIYMCSFPQSVTKNLLP